MRVLFAPALRRLEARFTATAECPKPPDLNLADSG
jgi:hypothetical protein